MTVARRIVPRDGRVDRRVQTVRRLVARPWPSRPWPQIVHVSHHKTGTMWWQAVLATVARSFGLRVGRGREGAGDEVDVLLCQGMATWAPPTRPFRGTHMVRDPRAMVVSGYHHHRRAHEPWLHRPHAVSGRTYQQELLRLDPDEGLMLEIERCARGAFSQMRAWQPDPDILELRFEDVRADEAAGFRLAFEHYGLRPPAVERAVELAVSCSLDRRGPVEHARPGGTDWRSELGPAHLDRIHEVAGDLIARHAYDEGATP